VQDTTQVDLSHHPHTAGVGYVQDLKHTGFLLHSTLMVTPQREPLGLIQQQVWVRDPVNFKKRAKRHVLATAEKESQKWLTSLQAVAASQKELPETQLVSVGDSEADVYALFAEGERLGQAFLVRGCRDRLILNAEVQHIWQHVTAQPVSASLEVEIPRQDQRPMRKATLSIRLAQVELKVPKREKARQDYAHLTAWAILAKEEHPPEAVETIEWRLLTNVPTLNGAQAGTRVDWYSCRWAVEMFQRVLKSGCRLEERQFDDRENFQRYLAVDSIVAWHVLYLVLYGREHPDLPCDVVLAVHEWQALYCFVHKTQQPPEQTPTLDEAIQWIARLGGFTASRKHAPGTTVMWRGLSRLADISQAWSVFHPDP
jgi:hypothetical protein